MSAAWDTKKYREHLYHHRQHPAGATSSKDESFSYLYFSLLPFLAVEFWTELHFEKLPQGIVFPFSYLIFWAFYYTYRKPGHLEETLKGKAKWDLLSIPTVLLGALIWFVKVTVVELSQILLVRGILGIKKAQEPKKEFKAGPEKRTTERRETPRAPTSTLKPLPRDVENALVILGIQDCRDWHQIQKRYRELAKKFHPDLNPELTQAGNRFMVYDAAYKKLYSVKALYFESPKNSRVS